jgi:hypothetical protein
MGLQQGEEFLERAGGVTNGQDDERRF